MDFLEIYFLFYFSYWLRLMLLVCGDIESNPGPGTDRRVWVLYSNIRGLHANLDELDVAGSDYDGLVCAESFIAVFESKSKSLSLSELRISGFGCPKQRPRNSTPGAQGMDGSLC